MGRNSTAIRVTFCPLFHLHYFALYHTLRRICHIGVWHFFTNPYLIEAFTTWTILIALTAHLWTAIGSHVRQRWCPVNVVHTAPSFTRGDVYLNVSVALSQTFPKNETPLTGQGIFTGALGINRGYLASTNTDNICRDKETLWRPAKLAVTFTITWLQHRQCDVLFEGLLVSLPCLHAFNEEFLHPSRTKMNLSAFFIHFCSGIIKR